MTFKLCKVAVSFMHPADHTAKECANAIAETLEQYGLTLDDVLCSVNDTTNAAVATANLLSETGGTCMIHIVQLIIGYAVGKKVRKERVGVFELCGALTGCDEMFASLSRLNTGVMGVTCTARGARFEEANPLWDEENKLIKMTVVADTRVGSAVGTLENGLRMKHAVANFRHNELEEVKKWPRNAKKRDAANASAELCPHGKIDIIGGAGGSDVWTSIADVAAVL